MRTTLCILLGWFPWLLAAQQTDTTYWQQNAQALVISGDSIRPGLLIEDRILQKYQFFFTAEQHWRSINTQLQFAFLRYLHQHANVRNLIVEGGYSYGFLVNEYLKTGDQRLLKKVINDIPVCPDDQLGLFQKIYRYNQQFPEEEHIQVTGIDIEHSPEIVLQCLNKILPEHDPPAVINRQINKLQELHRSRFLDEKGVKKFFKKLYKDLARRENIYKKFWGEDFDLFQLVLKKHAPGL